jgi:pyruvate-ferredoxin/flavodoxin oxidoreductase
MRLRRPAPEAPRARYPGTRAALSGSAAVVEVELVASDAAASYPSAPATEMGDAWAAAAAAGRANAFGRPVVGFEPADAAAAATVTAGMSMAGLRATSFSSGPGVAAMHESLCAAAGKRLTWVLHVASRALTRQALSVHAAHDDYHAVDDAGLFQLFAANAQAAADLALLAHRIAELSLTPGVCAQDGWLTSDAIESLRLPERELVREFLGDPRDLIAAPTAAQRLVFGPRRRRIPELLDLDYPGAVGGVQRPDSYPQSVAAQRPFYLDHVAGLADRAFEEYAALTGRRYARAAGYRVEDAEYAIVAQGSVVPLAEAVCDHLRGEGRVRLGVVNLTMFRPFPADRLTALLRGKRSVLVLERVDQPLAVDPPLSRELRAAFGKGVENWRARTAGPAHPGLPACAPGEVPDFYAGCFGLGGRDLPPGELVAAVDRMLAGGAKPRHFYLGIDFVRKGTRLPKLQIWQEQLLESYPGIAELALAPAAADLDLQPNGAISARIHSRAGWDGVPIAKSVAAAAAALPGLSVRATVGQGSEMRGRPTTSSVTLAQAPIRASGEPRRVGVVLAADPTPFRHGDLLAGLVDGGRLVLPGAGADEAPWHRLPPSVQRAVRERGIEVFGLDAEGIVAEETPEPGLRARLRGAAFVGAFFRVTRLAERLGIDETKLLARLRGPLARGLGGDAAEPGLRVVGRGFAEVRRLDTAPPEAAPAGAGPLPEMPALLESGRAGAGLGHPGRFWEQVGYLFRTGRDGIADPFAAVGVLPAASAAMRDMTEVRLTVPELSAGRCTGCGRCWTQCPDTAILGVVNRLDEVLQAVIAAAAGTGRLDRLRSIVRPLADAGRRALAAADAPPVAEALSAAYRTVVEKLGYDAARRAALDAEWAPVEAALADFPLVRTAAFFERPEAAQTGSGGLLSLTVSPEACKGCNLCVEVCPEGALRAVPQDDAVAARLRRQATLWRHLPETDDRYVEIARDEAGVGPLPALLLKKEHQRSLSGGDAACPGCGQKTAVHLVLAAVSALVRPRVRAHVDRLDDLIAKLDQKARTLLASDADLAAVAGSRPGTVDLPLEEAKRRDVERIAAVLAPLRDLRWRYAEGPGGRGRAACAIASAPGCSAVWGGTYPYTPYPVPWASHLLADAPALAVGLFEAQMRKMAEGVAAVRRAELELAGEYDPAVHEPALAALDWRSFGDDELALCPPLLVVGGDGAAQDAGLQNLSRLLASGRPIRVVVLDTQGYASTGGQPGTGGFPGQAGGPARPGAAGRRKAEGRKELALLAIAHRDAFVLQSSAAAPSHLLGGLLAGLNSRYPAVFSLYTPCLPGHGLPDHAAPRAARLALESRAFPLLRYDPAAGPTLAERLSLEGNPALDDAWPPGEVRYVDESGAEQRMMLPVTVADWAATEGRFRHGFAPVPAEAGDAELVPVHDYLARPPEERSGTRPFLHVLEADRRLGRRLVGDEIVRLAEERQAVWSLLRELAGFKMPKQAALEAEFERKAAALEAEYAAKLADLKGRYPQLIARRLVETLLRARDGQLGVAELLDRVEALPVRPPAGPEEAPPAATPPAAAPAAAAASASPAAAPAAAAVEAEKPLTLEPYIDSALCTACNECTNLNKRMFSYNGKKQAYIRDPRAGTFKDLVTAAEKSPVRIIHPGTPLNPDEKDLAKWVKRAQPFN